MNFEGGDLSDLQHRIGSNCTSFYDVQSSWSKKIGSPTKNHGAVTVVFRGRNTVTFWRHSISRRFAVEIYNNPTERSYWISEQRARRDAVMLTR